MTRINGHIPTAQAVGDDGPAALHTIRRVHMIGIGGAGMSGIALVLNALGLSVAGSDMRLSAVTESLEKEGIRVVEGHHADNVAGAQVVVYSSAVNPDNPELRAAAELNIPAIERSEMLGELTRLWFTIGVAGTHGKPPLLPWSRR